MKEYTVVLMRDYRFSDIPEFSDDPDTDCYVAHVSAEDHTSAVKAARQQAFDADAVSIGRGSMRRGKDFLQTFELDVEDYNFICLFDGKQDPKLFGFQTGPWQRRL